MNREGWKFGGLEPLTAFACLVFGPARDASTHLTPNFQTSNPPNFYVKRF